MNNTENNGIRLASDLWLDQADYLEKIEQRRDSNLISESQADQLLFFAENGYLISRIDIDDSFVDRFSKGIDRIWREKPDDLAFARDSPAVPMSLANETTDRRVRYRIHDLHSHMREALNLYLHPGIFSWVKLILGDQAVAIQSLYFEYGSEQMAHRDPVVVPFDGCGHLVAAWVALEDISADSGALVYYPGSHKLPYYEFAPGQHMFDASRMGKTDVDAAFAFDERQCQIHGIQSNCFTAKRGDVFIWHASMRHGGTRIANQDLTRQSFVIHYSRKDTYPSRSIRICSSFNADPSNSILAETSKLIDKDGVVGFHNPLCNYNPTFTGD